MRKFGQYLIESLTEYIHPKVIMCSRFVKFHDSLINCKKRILANCNKNGLRTVYGSNLFKTATECNLKTSELSSNCVKTKMKYFPLPENEKWRVPLINELLSVKAQNHILPGFTSKEIDDFIVYACTS